MKFSSGAATAAEAAVVLLGALEERGNRRGKPLTRARLSRSTLKQLWNREIITVRLIEEINEHLAGAGWVIVTTETMYGAVKISVIENWPRVAAKHFEAAVHTNPDGTVDTERYSALMSREAWQVREDREE
jgi:hypothetical protein